MDTAQSNVGGTCEALQVLVVAVSTPRPSSGPLRGVQDELAYLLNAVNHDYLSFTFGYAGTMPSGRYPDRVREGTLTRQPDA
ncbi:hypothetical protein [Rhodococcus erythropolis]|uniref:hypothetical protein n=1 Tax=Rhodococcus erythropolis TaxID=1833 RepID=UPI001F379110|nr:hypothetical protein [Rhodococcus erythropolis]